MANRVIITAPRREEEEFVTEKLKNAVDRKEQIVVMRQIVAMLADALARAASCDAEIMKLVNKFAQKGYELAEESKKSADGLADVMTHIHRTNEAVKYLSMAGGAVAMAGPGMMASEKVPELFRWLSVRGLEGQQGLGLIRQVMTLAQGGMGLAEAYSNVIKADVKAREQAARIAIDGSEGLTKQIGSDMATKIEIMKQLKQLIELMAQACRARE